ncbi:MAG: DUF134 domain-containing protein [Candidatus Coproplasma sp.]
MARPTKERRVCHFPEVSTFVPDGENVGQPVLLAVDEYETIRLIDNEGLSQEECATQLGVGRTTVQSIYDSARKKIAKALVAGCPIKIEGGKYCLCNGNTDYCYKMNCIKRKIQSQVKLEKGDNIMRIAVTYENGEIFQHFGHTQTFKVYDIEDGKVVSSQIIDTNGTGHGALAGLLADINADVLICGGIGGGAQMALSQAGVKLYGGVCGNADEAVEAFITGKLDYNPDVHCDHHHHDHGEEHSCGSHGCGHGKCGDN